MSPRGSGRRWPRWPTRSHLFPCGACHHVWLENLGEGTGQCLISGWKRCHGNSECWQQHWLVPRLTLARRPPLPVRRGGSLGRCVRPRSTACTGGVARRAWCRGRCSLRASLHAGGCASQAPRQRTRPARERCRQLCRPFGPGSDTPHPRSCPGAVLPSHPRWHLCCLPGTSAICLPCISSLCDPLPRSGPGRGGRGGTQPPRHGRPKGAVQREPQR